MRKICNFAYFLDNIYLSIFILHSVCIRPVCHIVLRWRFSQKVFTTTNKIKARKFLVRLGAMYMYIEPTFRRDKKQRCKDS